MSVDVHIGHCLDVLAELPEESVQCVITSPPYWGLRDYGLEPVVWGGEPGCGHEWGYERLIATGNNPSAKSTLTTNSGAGPKVGDKYVASAGIVVETGRFCLRCNAWCGSLGLEPTPDLYVAHLVEVFRDIRRVLRRDGTCWLNLGDSYQGSGLSGGKNPAIPGTLSFRGSLDRGRVDAGLKPKDLVMIPARVALALQEPYYDGKIKDERGRIWLAAMLDTEGNIAVNFQRGGKHRKADSYSLSVKVHNTNRALVESCARIAGCGSVKLHDTRRRHCFAWAIYGEDARRVLREVYPHLVAKTQEARIGYKHIDADGYAAIRLLHSGMETTLDAPDPPSCLTPGWYLRSDIIWAKPNPMPESVRDRPIKSYEHVFLLAKSAKYFYDAAAVAEPAVKAGLVLHAYNTGAKDRMDANGVNDRRTRIGLAGWNKPAPENRNLRDVWTIPTAPYPEAHFATFPAALVEPCVKAGTKPGDVVLDPFAGSGTVGEVARRYGRDAILIEAQPKYRALIEKRLAQEVLPL